MAACKSIKNKSDNNSSTKASTPALDSLQQMCLTPFEKLQQLPDTSGVALYIWQGRPFTGWSCQTFAENAHRYRFTSFNNGAMNRQIAYYANGTHDADIGIKNGKSFGHELMWYADGTPYVSFYYAAPGVMHGLQQRWHSNKVIAYKAVFDMGKLIYAIDYDKDGNVISEKGRLPK